MSTDIRFEWAPQEVTDRLARLEEHRKNVATREDVVELKGLIELNRQDLRSAFESAVSTSENTTLKSIIKSWAIVAGIVFPLLTGLIVALLNALLNQ